MTHPSRIVVCTALLLAVSPPAARGFDLTGHWVGKTSCKGLGDGAKFAGKSDIVADVSQSGRDVNIGFQGFSFLTLARAIAVPSAKNADKGEVGFVACDNEPDPVFGVTGRAKVATKPSKGTGTMRFVAIVAGKDLNGLGVADATFTCTGTLKRTSTVDPGVGGCPVGM
jgi:hypothetical protein